MHLLNWIIAVSGAVVMLWFAAEFHLSQWGFVGIFLLFALPYGFFMALAEAQAETDPITEAETPGGGEEVNR